MKSFTISATLALGAFSVQIKQMAVDAAQYEIENRLDAIGVDTYVIQDELDKLADYTQEKGDDAWDTAQAGLNEAVAYWGELDDGEKQEILTTTAAFAAGQAQAVYGQWSSLSDETKEEVIKSGAEAGKDWIEDELSAAGIDTAALYDEWTVIQGAIQEEKDLWDSLSEDEQYDYVTEHLEAVGIDTEALWNTLAALEQSDDWETSADILYDSLESSGFDTDDLKDYGELATDIAESVLEAYGVDTDALKEGASASYADWDELDDQEKQEKLETELIAASALIEGTLQAKGVDTEAIKRSVETTARAVKGAAGI